MNLKEITEKLGIKSYPESLFSISESIDTKGGFTSPEFVRALNEKYNLLGEYEDIVAKAAALAAGCPELNAYGRIVTAYNETASIYESRLIEMPAPDGSPAVDLFPVLLLLNDASAAVKRYEARGFSDAEIIKNLGNIRINVWVNDLLYARPMLIGAYYNWLRIYIHAYIFDHRQFNFQPSVWTHPAIYLKNRHSGEFCVMMTSGRFHRDGLILGSAGATDTEGAFFAEFNEFPDVYIGHTVKDGRVDSKLTTLQRDEWECVLRQGDDVVKLHIPRGADLTPESAMECIREGFELTKRYYPELSPKFIVCYSWLLEPKIVDILGEDAKLSKFNRLFTKIPMLDDGEGCLGYVFPGKQSDPIESLPEDTSLRRGVKKTMLDGGFMLRTAGVILDL